MRTGVEVAITDLAAERIDEAGIAGLHDALSREEHATDAERVEAVHDLHAAVAAAAQNRVLNLVALVLIRLSRLHQIERLAPKMQRQIQAEVLTTHTGIAEAVAAGDRELARHRMRRHLEALGVAHALTRSAVRTAAAWWWPPESAFSILFRRRPTDPVRRTKRSHGVQHIRRVREGHRLPVQGRGHRTGQGPRGPVVAGRGPGVPDHGHARRHAELRPWATATTTRCSPRRTTGRRPAGAARSRHP